MSANSYLQEFGFQDPYQDPYVNVDPIYRDDSEWGADTVGGWLDRTFDPKGYQLYKDIKNIEYERSSTNSARAWDLWMDSNAVQRRVKDIKAAGLNPWLALQSGGISANTSTQTANSGSSARSSKDDSGSMLKSLLGAIVVVAKIMALVA